MLFIHLYFSISFQLSLSLSFIVDRKDCHPPHRQFGEPSKHTQHTQHTNPIQRHSTHIWTKRYQKLFWMTKWNLYKWIFLRERISAIWLNENFNHPQTHGESERERERSRVMCTQCIEGLDALAFLFSFVDVMWCQAKIPIASHTCTDMTCVLVF